jgi:hypothetical protein
MSLFISRLDRSNLQVFLWHLNSWPRSPNKGESFSLSGKPVPRRKGALRAASSEGRIVARDPGKGGSAKVQNISPPAITVGQAGEEIEIPTHRGRSNNLYLKGLAARRMAK